MRPTYEDILDKLKKHGQEHLVKYWEDLDEQNREILLDELIKTDFCYLENIYKKAEISTNSLNERLHALDKIDSSKQLDVDVLKLKQNETERLKLIGYEAISNGQVGIILLAGGISSRLSIDYPKGIYSVDLLSGKSLFQIQAERLIKIKQLSMRYYFNKSVSVPWFIMTSQHTHNLTVEFFEENDFFGIEKEDVYFFKQEMIECVNKQNKLLLEEKYKIKKIPNGTGGLFTALKDNKIIEEMQRRSIKYIHIYNIENILVKIADPLFTGICIENNYSCAGKVVKKYHSREPMSAACKSNDSNEKFFIDYSILSINNYTLYSNGSIFYGDIGYYFLGIDLLRDLCRDLKMINVHRKEEYSPLKYMRNKSEFYTKLHCKDDLINLHYSWLTRAGARFYHPGEPGSPIKCVLVNSNDQTKADDLPNLCEISPLISYEGEDLEEHVQDRSFEPPLVLDFDPDSNQCTFNGIDFVNFDKTYSTSKNVQG